MTDTRSRIEPHAVRLIPRPPSLSCVATQLTQLLGGHAARAGTILVVIGAAMGPLSPFDLERLETEGWVLAKGVIPLRYITALQDEISGVVDRKARELAAEGKVAELHADAGFLTRAALIYEQCPEIMKVLRGGTHAGQAMFDLLTCPARDAHIQLLTTTTVA